MHVFIYLCMYSYIGMYVRKCVRVLCKCSCLYVLSFFVFRFIFSFYIFVFMFLSYVSLSVSVCHFISLPPSPTFPLPPSRRLPFAQPSSCSLPAKDHFLSPSIILPLSVPPFPQTEGEREREGNRENERETERKKSERRKEITKKGKKENRKKEGRK